MQYVDSANVKVYPCAYRGQTSGGALYNPESRYPIEENVTSQIKSLLASGKNFVISLEEIVENSVKKLHLKFVISGYYFDVVANESLFYDAGYEGYMTNVYAHIKISPKNTNMTNPGTDYLCKSLSPVYNSQDNALDVALVGVDTFIGLGFSDTETETLSSDSLLVLMRNTSTNSYFVPNHSKFRYSTSDVENGTSGLSILDKFSTGTLEVSGNSYVEGELHVDGDVYSDAVTTQGAISTGSLFSNGDVRTLGKVIARADSNGTTDPSYGYCFYTPAGNLPALYSTFRSIGAGGIDGDKVVLQSLLSGAKVELSTTIGVNKDIKPLGTSGSINLGSPTSKFNNVYCTKLYGDVDGNITGQASELKTVAKDGVPVSEFGMYMCKVTYNGESFCGVMYNTTNSDTISLGTFITESGTYHISLVVMSGGRYPFLYKNGTRITSGYSYRFVKLPLSNI